jgi:RND family efflux transporter MFP subunit
LTRAQDDAVKTASDKLDAANKARDDAQRAYNKAVQDKTRAAADNRESNNKKVESAEKALTDAKKQLESAQNSVKNAENALSQAQAKPGTAGKNVELQSLSLEKLNRQLAEGEIIAEASGVITAISAKVGATPQGVLFVIDNKDELYVSARVKEYNLNSLAIGQEILITTDATGSQKISATLSYVSPKAVSEAGSTSVEFEVRATLTDPDEAIKIGMNAFMNIIVETKENVYAVPVSTIVTNEKGSFIYAAPEEPSNGGGRGKKPKEAPEPIEIPVTLGLKTSTSVEISGAGLKDGLQILTDPEGKLSDGSEISANPFGG